MRVLVCLIRSMFLTLPLALLAGCGLDHITAHDGCHGRGCDDVVTRSYDLAGFDEVDCRGGIEVLIRQGAGFRVTATVPDRLQTELEVRLEGSRLVIRPEDHWHGSHGDVEVTVEMPRLRRLAAGSGTEVRLEGISSPGSIEMEVEDASQVRGDLTAQAAVLRLGGASQAELNGTASRLDLEASGASQARLRDLSTRRADVELRSLSRATISVSDWLEVTVRELSCLHYAGRPQLGRVDVSGGSCLDALD